MKAGRTVREMRLGESDASLEVELRVEGADDAIAGLARFGTVTDGADGRVRVRVPGDEALPEIVRWLVGRGAAVYEVRPARRGLEEHFLEVMGEDQRPG